MKVVSFCHVLQGPAATQYLGDMGADIIKIEPIGGERSRRWAGADMPEMGEGVTGLYLCAFRNKRLLSVDLKSPEGRQIVMSLIEKADVVVENFRHGVMDRLGFSYEDLKARNPGIIYASGTGWGSVGPMLARESQDLIIQARTGLASATGSRHGGAKAVGSAVIDQHGGALLAMGIVAAYAKKLATGKGTRVESSLFAAGLDLQTEPLTVYMSTRPGAKILDREPHLATWYHHAPYGVYALTDCEIVVSTNPVEKLADALQSEELARLKGCHPYHDRDVIAEAFAKVLKTKSYAQIEAAFTLRGIWYGKVQDFDAVAEDPQAKAMDVFRQIDIDGKSVTLVNHPIRYDSQVPELRTLGFAVGQHTREILTENGLSTEAIDDLFARGIVAGPAQ